MSLIKYLNHRQKFFASVLPSILTCSKISSEIRVKVFPDETPLNGKIYASPTVAPLESHLLVPLPPCFATQDQDQDRDWTATLMASLLDRRLAIT